MFSIVITEKGGAQRQLEFEAPEIGIGRLEDNELCLPKNNVSKYHARLVYKDDRYVLVDQKSTNGTYVNGRRISAPMVVRKGDKIYIGDFILTLGQGAANEAVAAREFRPIKDAEHRGPTVPTKAQDPGHTISDRPLEAANAAAMARSPSLPPPLPAAATTVAPPKRVSVPPPLPSQRVVASEPARSTEAPERPAAAKPVPQPQPAAHEAPETVAPPRPSPAPKAPARRSPLPKPPPPAASAPPEATPSARDASPQKPPHEAVATPAKTAARPTQEAVPAAVRAPTHEAGKVAAAADSGGTQGPVTSPAVLAPSVRLQGALAQLMERLATQMNVARGEESAFPSEHQAGLDRLLDELAEDGALGPDLDRRYLREAAISEAVGLGPLDRLLANRSVREIVVDGPTRVLADLGGGLTPVSSFFSDEHAVLLVARRLLHRSGKRLDPELPLHEGVLSGGGLVQVLLPPLAPRGPLIAVRCPPRALPSPESLVTDGTLSSDMLALIRSSVQQRKNLLVLGPMGAGVSSLLAVLTTLAPDHDRIVTIEHAPSVSLLNPQALPLARNALPDLPLGELLRRAAQLRYDRLVIDDLRPEDALTALGSAAAIGGVLLGMHAPDPQIGLSLLELYAEAALGQKARGLTPLLAAAVQLVVHVAPDASGTRRVQSVSELRENSDGSWALAPRFRYDGKAFLASDQAPSFLGS